MSVHCAFKTFMVMENTHNCMLSLHNSSLSLPCKISQPPNSLHWKILQFFDSARQRSLMYCRPCGRRLFKPMKVTNRIFRILNEACRIGNQMLRLLRH